MRCVQVWAVSADLQRSSSASVTLPPWSWRWAWLTRSGDLAQNARLVSAGPPQDEGPVGQSGDPDPRDVELLPDETTIDRVASALIVVAIIALPILAVIIGVRLYQAGSPNAHINPFNQIFASRIVLAAVRMAI